MEHTHAYTSAIVGQYQEPSRFVRLKSALRRQREGNIVSLHGVSNGVIHFRVKSSSLSGLEYRVEYDTNNKSFRCQCTAGFYGLGCHHVQSIRDALHIQ